MKLKFIEPNIKEGRRYHGEISRYSINDKKKSVYIFAVIDDEPEMEFMKRFEYNLSIYSQFADFCENMCIFTDDLEVDLNELIGRKVFLRLVEVDRKMYINEIWLDEDYYDIEIDEDGEYNEQ